MDEKPYYQATVSGTRIEALPPDPENIGLEDFHRDKEEEVDDFIKGPEGILVMGGIGGIGKTHTLKRIVATTGAEFLSLESPSNIIYQIKEFGVDIIVQKLISEIQGKAEGNSGTLVVDEGRYLHAGPRDEGTRSQIREVIRELQSRYPHMIILGGGEKFSSEEQTEMIAEALPREIRLTTKALALKTLNLRQTTELARTTKVGFDQAGEIRMTEDQHKEYVKERTIDIEIARVIASTIDEYFRLFRPILRISNGILDGREEKYPYLHVRSNMMPKNIFEEIWPGQFARIKETIKQLKTSRN